jgi:hypothetical protein
MHFQEVRRRVFCPAALAFVPCCLPLCYVPYFLLSAVVHGSTAVERCRLMIGRRRTVPSTVGTSYIPLEYNRK